jgi:hypothetical protein
MGCLLSSKALYIPNRVRVLAKSAVEVSSGQSSVYVVLTMLHCKSPSTKDKMLRRVPQLMTFKQSSIDAL